MKQIEVIGGGVHHVLLTPSNRLSLTESHPHDVEPLVMTDDPTELRPEEIVERYREQKVNLYGMDIGPDPSVRIPPTSTPKSFGMALFNRRHR